MHFLNLAKSANRLVLSALFFALFQTAAFTQCNSGEVEVQFILDTDAWGYEVYWELYPEGVSCGEAPIISGGNAAQVGCTGGGQQDATGGNGYANNVTIELDPICLEAGVPLTLHYVDDYGDGGFTIQVYENGSFITQFQGSGDGNLWSYTPGSLVFVDYNNPCGAVELNFNEPAVLLTNTDANVNPGEPAPPGGGCQTAGQWCEGNLSNTVWMKFTTTEASTTIMATTCNSGTNFDTQLALYAVGDCNDFSTFELIAANDDVPGGCGPGNGFASTLYAGCLNAGVTYYLQVDGYNGQTGNFAVSIESFEEGLNLQANVVSMPCAIDKGQPGAGEITVFVSGLGENPTIEWEGPNGFTGDEPSIDQLEAGSYTITVTTDCGVYTDTYEVTMPQPLFPTLNLNGPDCPLTFNGSAAVNLTGGTQPYDFLWSGPNNYFSGAAEPNNLGEGPYSVTIVDGNGCEAELSFTIEAQNNIAVDLGANQTICTDESLLLFAPPGYNYLWQDGSINQFFFVEGDITGEGNYTYVVTISTDDGCEASDAVTVNVEACTSIAEETFFGMDAFPNPFHDQLIIDLPVAAECTVFTAHGKVILQQRMPAGKSTLMTADWASGMYLVQLATEAGSRTLRLIHP
jgi:hypothetical protein